MTPPKQPPPGVETTPGGSVVPLSEAAARLGKDPRTLIRAITSGAIRGGAMPRPERLRWYVYTDELPTEPSPAAPAPPDARVEDLRAQVISLMEANRLLIAVQQDLLDAGQSAKEAADTAIAAANLAVEAASKSSLAADKYRAVSRSYADALSQFMTPGHLGDLTDPQ
jgi:hypothetical protein